MKQIPYHCTRPKEFMVVDGVRANYDGEVFSAVRGRMQAYITAAKGETVFVTVGEHGGIWCPTRKKNRPDATNVKGGKTKQFSVILSPPERKCQV